MLKTPTYLIINYTALRNLTKSTFRNFSKAIYKPNTNTLNYFPNYKYLLQLQTSVCNATRNFGYSKLTNIHLTKDASITDNFQDALTGIEDPERRDEVLNIIKFLLGLGCSEEEIKTNCLPHIISSQSSYSKVKLLTDIHPNVTVVMPLLSYPITALQAAAKHAHCDNNIISFPSRIEYLAHNLDTNIVDLIPMLVKHPSLLTMPFKRLQAKLKILKDAQIGSEFIAKDLWIFNYNEKLLEKRCAAALEAKVDLKPWMLRCSGKFFESMLRKWAQTQAILKGDNELSYLAKQLDCSEDYIKVLMEKNKLLMSINILKIEQILKFLKEKGYKSQEIRLFPRIFCTSLETLSKRFEVLHKHTITLPTLSRLCVSSKNFETIGKTKKSSKQKDAIPEESN